MLRGPLRLAEALAVVPARPHAAALSAAAVRGPARDRRRSDGERRFRRCTKVRQGQHDSRGADRGDRPAPALAALRDPDLAAYHGAEHKAIGAYESGGDAADEPKEHERCGSNLIGPMLAFSVAGQVIVEGTLERPNAIARGAASLAATGAAVEVFAFSERNPDAALSRAVHGAGYEIQRLVSTREPTREQLEVGEAAVLELLRVEPPAADRSQEGSAGVPPIPT